MCRALVLSIMMLASALSMACSDKPAPSEPNKPFPASFRTEQNPEGPGAFAVHVPEGYFAEADFDPPPGITVVAGVTFAQHVQFCETGESPFPLERFLVFRPDGSIKTWVKGVNIPLVVWQAVPTNPTDNIFADICTTEFLALPHLEGTGQFLDRDNDLTLSLNRANSFGPRIVGQVSSATGDRFKFLAKIHIVLLRTGEPALEVFDFRLKPIGQ